MPSTISAGTTAGTAIAVAGDTTGNLAFQTNGTTTAMTIDTSQNVGIGTTSPSAPLQVNGTATAVRATSAQLWLSRTTSSTQYQGVCFRSGPATDGFIGRAPNSDNIILGFDAGASLATQMSLSNGGDLAFNSGYGSVATAYGCRAWVNFNGTGTVAIRGSGNVSSITDLTTGTYQINFTNTLPDANFAANITCDGGNAYIGTTYGMGTTAVNIFTWTDASAFSDNSRVSVSVFR